MVNGDKVILMTRLASYEKKEGKKYIPVTKFFRSDYLSMQIMKSFLYATLVFGILVGLFVLYDFEIFMEDLYKIDIITLVLNIIKYYITFVVVYCIATYVLFSIRYVKAKKSVKKYYHNLKKLNAMQKK